MSKHYWEMVSPVYRYPGYTVCIKVSDFSLYKGVSYKRLCDFSHLPLIGNYIYLFIYIYILHFFSTGIQLSNFIHIERERVDICEKLLCFENTFSLYFVYNKIKY